MAIKDLFNLVIFSTAVSPFSVYFHEGNNSNSKQRQIFMIDREMISEGFRVPERSIHKTHNIRDNFVSFAQETDDGYVVPQRFYIQNDREVYIRFQTSVDFIEHKLPSKRLGDVVVPQYLGPGLHFFDLDLVNLKTHLKEGKTLYPAKILNYALEQTETKEKVNPDLDLSSFFRHMKSIKSKVPLERNFDLSEMIHYFKIEITPVLSIFHNPKKLSAKKKQIYEIQFTQI